MPAKAKGRLGGMLHACVPPGAFPTHQHNRTQVKLLVELGDEDVDVGELLLVLLLDLADDVRHPLKLLLRTRDPQEVNLFKGNKEAYRH